MRDKRACATGRNSACHRFLKYCLLLSEISGCVSSTQDSSIINECVHAYACVCVHVCLRESSKQCTSSNSIKVHTQCTQYHVIVEVTTCLHVFPCETCTRGLHSSCTPAYTYVAYLYEVSSGHVNWSVSAKISKVGERQARGGGVGREEGVTSNKRPYVAEAY